MIYYDLHIHSALSPCSDDDMTLNNIINMSCLKELDLIAVSDHNTLKQLKFFKQLAKNKIDFLYGVEIQTKENIHVLGYFGDDLYLDNIQEYLDTHLIKKTNNPEFYGKQIIFDENDEIIGYEENLLINSLDQSIREVIDMIHRFHGKAVLAHVNRKYGIIAQLGTIPESLDFDGIEINQNEQKESLLKQYPFLEGKIWLINSDAHHLWSIHEAENCITDEEYKLLKGS